MTAPLSQETLEWLMTPGVPDGPALAALLRRPAWMTRAACRGEPLETFFPERGGSHRRAREMCAGCPVQPDCLSFALEDTDTAGWWGGTAEQARRNMVALQTPAERATQPEPAEPAAAERVPNRKGRTAQGVGRIGTLTLGEFAAARGYDPVTATYSDRAG